LRQPAQPSSALYQPLDYVLGSPVLIRVLRVLAVHGGALSAALVAERAKVTRTAARNALYTLVQAGVAETVGTGRSVLYRLRGDHPLAAPAAALFAAEASRVPRILERVRGVAEQMQPRPRAVWLFGSVARGGDQMRSDVDLAVVGEGGQVEDQAEQLREALDEIASEHRIRPSVITLTVKEARSMAERGTAFWKNLDRDAIVLVGDTPRQVARG
jgi:predicted nucleotidyltransferase